MPFIISNDVVPNLILDADANAVTAAIASVVLWTNLPPIMNTPVWRQWEEEPADAGWFFLKNIGHNKYLDAHKPAASQPLCPVNVYAKQLTQNSHQQWRWLDASEAGARWLQNRAGGLYLDANLYNLKNGCEIRLFSKTNADNQKWRISTV